MSSDELPRNQTQGRPTDSVWFWLSIFLSGAAVAILLSEPKYSWRQPQIERQYQARQRSGATIAAPDDPAELSQTGKPTIISLRPLKIGTAVAIVVATAGFWFYRVRGWRGSRRSARQPDVNSGMSG